MLCQLRTLGGIFIKDRVGVIYMDQNFTLGRHSIEHFNHAARPGLSQVPHILTGFSTYVLPNHFIVVHTVPSTISTSALRIHDSTRASSWPSPAAHSTLCAVRVSAINMPMLSPGCGSS